MTISERLSAEAGSARDHLPLWQLLAFTVAGFLAIMTENMPAGLLPQIGNGLGVSEALAGQTVSDRLVKARERRSGRLITFVRCVHGGGWPYSKTSGFVPLPPRL